MVGERCCSINSKFGLGSVPMTRGRVSVTHKKDEASGKQVEILAGKHKKDAFKKDRLMTLAKQETQLFMADISVS